MVWSTYVNRRKRRKAEQAKSAERLGPKGKWPGVAGLLSATADVAPPAYRRDLTHRVEIAERGKPVLLPTRENEP